MKGRKKKNRVGKEALQEKVKEQERREKRRGKTHIIIHERVTKPAHTPPSTWMSLTERPLPQSAQQSEVSCAESDPRPTTRGRSRAIEFSCT